jgi:hypothetical protein
MTYGGVDVQTHVFLTSALGGGEWSASQLCRFTSGEGAWMGPRTGMVAVERRKILCPPGLELRPLGRPVRSQSRCQLRYSGSVINIHTS